MDYKYVFKMCLFVNVGVDIILPIAEKYLLFPFCDAESI